MDTQQTIGLVLILAGMADAVAAVVLAKRLEGKPNREVVLGSIGVTAVTLLVAGALLASRAVSLPG